MTSAFVLIQLAGLASREDIQAVHSNLHAIQGVKTVHFLAGPTDVIVFVDVADQAAMIETIGGLRSVKGVASTDTRIVISM
jgi:hypothetical protein